MARKLLISRAARVVQVCNNHDKLKVREAMGDVCILEHASIVVNSEGRIEAVGPADDIEAKYPASSFEKVIDARGKSVIPGLVDSHTHPVWAGDRVGEFAMKLAGATYMDIHKAGGGIHFTVRHTRAASEDELKELAMKRFDRMLAQGTTLVEGKSGYGLECETEMKMLKVLCACNKAHSIDIVSNYLGAHSIPSGLTEEQAVKDIVEVQLPSLQKLKDQHLVDVEQIDVFHEQGVFGTEATRRILEEGKRYGLGINFHGDELHAMGSAELAAELGAQAVSHVECISEAGISALAKSQCVAVVLPTTFYILRLHPPPVRRMIEAGVPVALASDFNPNAHCMSMPFVMNLACVMTRMSMPEALVAATINSAAALGRSADYGSIEVDKWADMVIVGSSRWEHLVYELADPPIAFVVKKGSIVHEKK